MMTIVTYEVEITVHMEIEAQDLIDDCAREIIETNVQNMNCAVDIHKVEISVA
tara:strand:+ start:603 stop:761 length:159 start_codon:yes stop_codon:yes gene_type:complete